MIILNVEVKYFCWWFNKLSGFFLFWRTSWDRFKLKEKIEERLDVHNYCSFKLIRLILYVVLFVVFLASLVTQKLSLAIASTKLPTERQKNEDKVSNSLQPFTVIKKRIHVVKHKKNTCMIYMYTFLKYISFRIYKTMKSWSKCFLFINRYIHQERPSIACYFWLQCVFRTF